MMVPATGSRATLCFGASRPLSNLDGESHMPERLADTILVKIDTDIDGARRKLARFEKEAEKRAVDVQRAF